MLSQFLVMFGFFALVLVSIFWINRGVSLFDKLISDGQSALVFLEFTTLGLPRLITTVLPIATFAAATYVTNRLSNESELTVMLATGTGPFRLAWSVLVFGTIIFVMASVLHHLLMPLAEEQLSKREREVAQNATASLLTDGRFLHPSDGVTFYSGSIDDTGVLSNVLLSDGRNPDEGVIYTAAKAYLIRNGDRTSLIMVDGTAQRLDIREKRLSTAYFRDFAFDISSLVLNTKNSFVRLDEITSFQLVKQWDEIAENSGQGPGRIAQAFHARFAEPFFCVAAALIGFATLLIGGYSRFGVWREVGIAFAILVAIDGARSTLQPLVRADASLWPMLYVPTVFSFLLVIWMLWYAAKPRGSFRRLFKRAVS